MPTQNPNPSEEPVTKLFDEFMDLLEAGAAPNSAEMKAWVQRAAKLPVAEREILFSYTNLGEDFVSSVSQTFAEMDPKEDLGRFGDRILDLADKKQLLNPEKLSEDGIE